MKVYKCDLCGRILVPRLHVRIQHWFSKGDICQECWRDFEKLRKQVNKND